VYVSDLRVRSNPDTYTYPDIAVVCGEPRFAEKDRNTLVNPTALVEVISPSTEYHDRGVKFHRYRQLESLKEYVLVSQDLALVETYVRQPSGSWLLSESSGVDAVATFESLDCKVSLAEIYHQVDSS
jgi:Uma2 family endonuclease